MISTDQIDGGTIGKNLFAGIVGIELFLVTFIAPAFTASAISGEREHQSYDLLRTTLLPVSHLVIGKLFSALAYIFLLLLSAIPLQSLSFILGGTDLPDMGIAILTLTVTSILLGTIGVYFSARFGRTLPASIATYGAALAIVVVTALVLTLFVLLTNPLMSNNSMEFRNSNISEEIHWGILLITGMLVCTNPVATLQVTNDYLVSQQNPWTFQYTFASGATTTLPSPWIVFTGTYLLISAFFFILTIRRINKVDEF
jgi:ABC-2 type transport system permease protein